MLRKNIIREMFIWFTLLLIVSYIVSRISIDYYNFVHVNFISLCRFLDLPNFMWTFMDNHIFYGAL
jgi:hypothetical protein